MITIPAMLIIGLWVVWSIHSFIEERERDKADAYRARKRLERGW